MSCTQRVSALAFFFRSTRITADRSTTSLAGTVKGTVCGMQVDVSIWDEDVGSSWHY